VDGIAAAFTDVLNEIERVTTDKYLGIEDFDSTAQRLQEMKAELDELKGESDNAPCIAIAEGFCPIWKNGDEIVDSMDEVRVAISQISENEAVKTLEKYTSALPALHAIPYIGWLGVAFYGCFFCSEKVLTVCRGGSCRACVACSCHAFFFIVFLVISAAIAAAAVAGSVLTNRLTFDEPFRNKPTVAELVDHVEVAFPRFYDVVLKDLIVGLRTTRHAFIVNAGACLVFPFHTIFACCCGVYYDETQQQSREVFGQL